jgi:hypothetical protein
LEEAAFALNAKAARIGWFGDGSYEIRSIGADFVFFRRKNRCRSGIFAAVVAADRGAISRKPYYLGVAAF